MPAAGGQGGKYIPPPRPAPKGNPIGLAIQQGAAAGARSLPAPQAPRAVGQAIGQAGAPFNRGQPVSTSPQGLPKIPASLLQSSKSSPWNVGAQHAPNLAGAVTKGLDIGKLISQLAKPTVGDVNPLGHPGWGNLSVDMGVDANAPAGTPIVAPNNSVVTHIDPNWYAGQPQVTMQLTSGPNKGKYWYVSEQIDHIPQVGQTIPKGHPVATYASSGTGIEIGWAADPNGTTLSQAHGTVNTAAGNEHRAGGTPEGQAFLAYMQHGGKPQATTTAQINAGLAAKGLIHGGQSGATPPSQVAPVSSGQVTPQLFAQNLLKGLGVPITQANMRAIVAWQTAEGGNWNNSAKYNPLNTTQSAPGASAMNSVGVKAYTSWQQGLQATLQTLQNGHYGGIVAALKAGSDPMAVAQAIGASPWGTSAQGVASALGSANGSLGGVSGSLPGGSSGGSVGSSSGGAPVSSAPASAGQATPATQPQQINTAVLSSLLKGSQGLWDTGSAKGSGFGGQSPLAYLPANQAITTAHQALQQVAGPTPLAAHPQTDVTKLKGASTFSGKSVAAWIAPILTYAKAHGWNGSVTIGYKGSFPHGGIDVTNPGGLAAALARSPYAQMLGLVSGHHFSHPESS